MVPQRRLSTCAALATDNVSGLQMGMEISVALARLYNCHCHLDFCRCEYAWLQSGFTINVILLLIIE